MSRLTVFLFHYCERSPLYDFLPLVIDKFQYIYIRTRVAELSFEFAVPTARRVVGLKKKGSLTVEYAEKVTALKNEAAFRLEEIVLCPFRRNSVGHEDKAFVLRECGIAVCRLLFAVLSLSLLYCLNEIAVLAYRKGKFVRCVGIRIGIGGAYHYRKRLRVRETEDVVKLNGVLPTRIRRPRQYILIRVGAIER